MRFARELRAGLEAKIEAEADYLASGFARDFADYQRRVGSIAGLRFALERMTEIEDKVSGRVTERGNT